VAHPNPMRILSVEVRVEEPPMRDYPLVSAFGLAAALAAILAAGCASSTAPAPDTVAVQLNGAGGDGFTLRVSSSFVREAVESALGSSLECRGELDPPLSALLGRLDREGPHARASVRRDGDVLRGARHGRRLRLRISGEDGGEVEIRMPWAAAECLLGRASTLREALARSGGRPVLEIRIAGAEGGRFRASLE